MRDHHETTKQQQNQRHHLEARRPSGRMVMQQGRREEHFSRGQLSRSSVLWPISAVGGSCDGKGTCISGRCCRQGRCKAIDHLQRWAIGKAWPSACCRSVAVAKNSHFQRPTVEVLCGRLPSAAGDSYDGMYSRAHEKHAAAAARTTANSSTANDVSMTVMAAPRLTRRRSGQRLAERTRAPPSTLMH